VGWISARNCNNSALNSRRKHEKEEVEDKEEKKKNIIVKSVTLDKSYPCNSPWRPIGV
jgi:hypothetical protein